jgi:predicted mannosyl-3-phosphoglycerate phosphatase (HAD superfamily)
MTTSIRPGDYFNTCPTDLPMARGKAACQLKAGHDGPHDFPIPEIVENEVVVDGVWTDASVPSFGSDD